MMRSARRSLRDATPHAPERIILDSDGNFAELALQLLQRPEGGLEAKLTLPSIQ